MESTSRWLNAKQTQLELSVPSSWTANPLLLDYQVLEQAHSSIGMVIMLPRTMSIPVSGFHQQVREMICQHEQYHIQPIVFVSRIEYTVTLLKEFIAILANHQSHYHFAPTREDALYILNS